MNGFRLHAVGEFFDVDRYLNQHIIDYNSVWRRGENLYTSSGFVKYLGNEFKLDIHEQETIAVKYIRQNRDALTALVKWENVETVILGISPEIQVRSGISSVCLSFSPLLVTLAGEIGLQLAFYIRPSISYDYEYDISEMRAGWQ
jgi:hypothetical protein